MSQASLAMLGCGERLRNTWLTYPQDGDKPGKLGPIPDRTDGLELVSIPKAQATMLNLGARGWGRA